MVRQRIKRVQPVFTHYNDSNISPVVKQNTIVQNDNKKLNSINKQSYSNNKYTNKTYTHFCSFHNRIHPTKTC